MKYIQSKPYILLLALIVVLLSLGFYRADEFIDVNIHDTYFVISWKHLMILISLIFGLLALIYFSLLKFRFRLKNWMTISHVLMSIIGLITVFTLSVIIRENVPGDYTALMGNIKFNERIGFAILISIFVFLGAQLLFFANVIYALIKGRS